MSSTAMQSLRPLVDRLRRGWRASPLPVFFGWWAGELRGMLPPHWHGWFGGGADWHLLQYAGTQWTLRRAGYSAVLARWDDSDEASATDAGVGQAAMKAVLQKVDRDDLRLALLLPPAAVLRRALVLPVAARDNLQQVMAFEMDRQTPFSMAQVYYAARELRGPAIAGRFNAELVVVTRGMLDPVLAYLHTLGVSIDAVDLAVDNERLGVNLLPSEQTPRHVRPRPPQKKAASGCTIARRRWRRCRPRLTTCAARRSRSRRCVSNCRTTPVPPGSWSSARKAP